MKLPWRKLAAAATLLAATPAVADGGALSFDLSAGVSGLNVAAPYAANGSNTFGVGFEAMLGMRYAITNAVEVTAAAYYQPNTGYSHGGVTVAPPDTLPFANGSLTHSLYLFGLLGGARYVTGSVWKLVVGLELGWCHRVYSSFVFVDSHGVQQNLGLQDFSTDNIVFQPLVGVEWAFADHWSASLIPRFTVLIGPDATVGVSLLLSFSYSWFL
jgi:hypothetical protein